MVFRKFLLLFISLLVSLTLKDNSVDCVPIKYTMNTFRNCVVATAGHTNISCCPPEQNLKGPIVNFVPKFDPSKPLLVKKALQCLGGWELKRYTTQLQKGYELMRALPDDDPRSLYQQSRLHCAYGMGSFLQDSTGIPLDVHYCWFFYPWHRYFLHFHERILRKLLKDPTFTLHFWNYDNSITVRHPRAHGSRRGCFKAGYYFPHMYNDASKATYSPNRSFRAYTPHLVVDLGIPASERDSGNVTILSSAEHTVARNRLRMHQTMITNADNPTDFFGRNYSVGDHMTTNFTMREGQWEFTHGSIHFWVGGIMAPVTTTAFDPIFYAHHMNADRMWTRWDKLRPNRTYPTWNRDWIDAEFLFWDENKVLRRVKLADSLSTEAFGYRFQKVNDASWIFYNETTYPYPDD